MTGLYRLSSRYYDPEIGRFISPDSVDYLDSTSINGLNLYAYCGDDPVNYSDRSGHFPIAVFSFAMFLTENGTKIVTRIALKFAYTYAWKYLRGKLNEEVY